MLFKRMRGVFNRKNNIMLHKKQFLEDDFERMNHD
jgi:hypothetical protein